MNVMKCFILCYICICIVSRNKFEFKHIIGKGGFGKVWKVIEKKTRLIYALKEMQKVKVIDKRSEKAIKYERELLARMKHPFIVNMYYSFQDDDNLYIVLDYLQGGDLRYHVSRYRKFTEEQTSILTIYNIYIYRVLPCMYNNWIGIYTFEECYTS